MVIVSGVLRRGRRVIVAAGGGLVIYGCKPSCGRPAVGVRFPDLAALGRFLSGEG